MVCGHEVDALFAAEQLIVELDGWDFHRDRYAFEADRDRDADALAAGLPTVRVTWERMSQTPGKEASRLHAILVRRRES
jgi:very-short-patch-repair endonuclease